MNKIKKILNKKNKSKIVCLTAYSKNFSEEIDKYVDIVLVGDSLGSVLYNYTTTRKVTLTEMINHSKSVKLGIKKSLMVVDMPYKTYDTKKSALKNARKVIKETKCDAVKLEGGKKVIDQIKILIKNKIPVFFIEKNQEHIIEKIKNQVPGSLFPETNSELSCPALVTALSSRLDQAVSIDNGVMHMMALAEIPMIVLFGPTNSEKFAPKNNYTKILDSKKLHGTKDIESISVDEVYDLI